MRAEEKVVQFPVLTPDSLAYISEHVLDEEQIEHFVAGLPADKVAEFCLGAERVKKQAAQAVKMAESRIIGEQILATGEVFTSPTGHEFMWMGDRRREVTDPMSLKAALEPLVTGAGELARRAFQAAFKPQPDKVYLTEIDRVAKFAPEAEIVIRSFTEWKEGPKHLRPIEETTR